MSEFEEDIWSDYDFNDYDDEPDEDIDDLYDDPRVNPCPDCDFGEVIHLSGVNQFAAYECSAGCGWSA